MSEEAERGSGGRLHLEADKLSLSLMRVCSAGLKVPRFAHPVTCAEARWGLCLRLPICVRSGCQEVFRMLLCLPALTPHSFEVPSIQPVFTEHLCEPGVICGRCVSLCTWLQGVRPILGSAISRTGFEFLGGVGRVWCGYGVGLLGSLSQLYHK